MLPKRQDEVLCLIASGKSLRETVAESARRVKLFPMRGPSPRRSIQKHLLPSQPSALSLIRMVAKR